MDEFLNLAEGLVAEDLGEKIEEKQQVDKQDGSEVQSDQQVEGQGGQSAEQKQATEKKEYTNEELEQLLADDEKINKIDLERVPENIRSVVSATIKRVSGQEQVAQGEQIRQYAEQIKEAARVEAIQHIRQQYGDFDPMNPEHVALVNQAVMHGEKLADNIVRAYGLISRLKQEDGEVFDKTIQAIQQEAARDPVIARAWDEADIAVLYPLYERLKTRFVKEAVQTEVENRQNKAPQVIEPSTGSHATGDMPSPGDLAGLGVDDQASLLVKMGLVD